MPAGPYASQFDGLRAKITQAAEQYGLDPKIAIAQLWQESRFKPSARSHVGAAGIAQFMPATAKRFGVNVADVDSSLQGYGKYMRLLLKMFGGKYDLALAAYNAGEGRVKRAGNRVPAIKETQNYVAIILREAGVGRPTPITKGTESPSTTPQAAAMAVTDYLPALGGAAILLILLTLND